MRTLLRILLGPLSVAGALCATSCGDDGVAPGADAGRGYWSSCPELPVWERSLDDFARDHPGESAYGSPEAAARQAVDGSLTVVATRESDAVAEVDVRLDGESGSFTVRHLDAGWVISRGEGCATWAAGEQFLGPISDDVSECRDDDTACFVEPEPQ